MGKLGIILASHGDFAKGALSCIETIAGKMDDISTITVSSVEDVELIENQMLTEYKELMKTTDEVFVFADIMCGTPCNVAARLLLTQKNVTVFAGFNIPILLEAVTRRSDPNCNFKELAKELTDSFASSLRVFSEEMKGGSY